MEGLIPFSCVASEKGWTSEDVCEAWFTKVFIKTANERRVSNAPIVLLLDGHGSHITTRVRDLAFQNGIFLFCLPPKTSHKTQPLDVGVFNLVQHAWKRQCEDSAQRGDPPTKSTAIANYMVAREAGLHPEAIVDAWRRSGHYPINPDIFTDADYAPSKVSSVIAQFPASFPGGIPAERQPPLPTGAADTPNDLGQPPEAANGGIEREHMEIQVTGSHDMMPNHEAGTAAANLGSVNGQYSTCMLIVNCRYLPSNRTCRLTGKFLHGTAASHRVPRQLGCSAGKGSCSFVRTRCSNIVGTPYGDVGASSVPLRALGPPEARER